MTRGVTCFPHSMLPMYCFGMDPERGRPGAWQKELLDAARVTQRSSEAAFPWWTQICSLRRERLFASYDMARVLRLNDSRAVGADHPGILSLSLLRCKHRHTEHLTMPYTATLTHSARKRARSLHSALLHTRRHIESIV